MSNYKFDFDFQKFTNTKYVTKNPIKGHFIALVLTILIYLVVDYVALPAWNPHDAGSMFMLAGFMLLFAVLDIIFTGRILKVQKVLGIGAALIAVVVVVLSILSIEPINAKKYRDQINIVETQDFSSSFETIALDKIPVVDRDSAALLGEKQIGKVQGLGSQFDVNPLYSLVTTNGNLYRVSPLEYQDFYKWFQNRNKGIPGYIKVNVNNPSDVEIVLLDEGMKYAPSAYFDKNLYRHVRFQYRDALLGEYQFEIDDSGKPYWVISTYEYEVGFYGGQDANGVIIVDPVTGESNRYAMDEIPSWVDRVQPTNFAWNQIDNWGYYVHGFINTLFGQKDMLQTTDGYNYVSIDNQLHIFSSLTSVGSDRSIVGFSLINLKTKDASFIRVGGADEYSAMNSAEGQVQHLGYRSTYPIILNMNDIPSYFVSLKDNEGLVKMYAFISVSDYNIVGVGNTVAEAQVDYIKKLNNEGIASNPTVDPNLKSVEGVVESLNIATVEGNSYYYITLVGDTRLFVLPIGVSSELPVTKVQDTVKIDYVEISSNTIVGSIFDNLNYQYE